MTDPTALFRSAADVDSVAIAVLTVYILQALKGSKTRALAWISRDNPGIVRFLSALAAALTAAGISWNFAPEAGTLVVSGLTAKGVATFFWLALKQFATQDILFRAGFKPFQRAGEPEPSPPGK